MNNARAAQRGFPRQPPAHIQRRPPDTSSPDYGTGGCDMETDCPESAVIFRWQCPPNKGRCRFGKRLFSLNAGMRQADGRIIPATPGSRSCGIQPILSDWRKCSRHAARRFHPDEISGIIVSRSNCGCSCYSDRFAVDAMNNPAETMRFHFRRDPLIAMKRFGARVRAVLVMSFLHHDMRRANRDCLRTRVLAVAEAVEPQSRPENPDPWPSWPGAGNESLPRCYARPTPARPATARQRSGIPPATHNSKRESGRRGGQTGCRISRTRHRPRAICRFPRGTCRRNFPRVHSL